MLANIDADCIVYEAGFASETTYYVVAEEEFFASKREAKEWAAWYGLPDDAIVKKVKPQPEHFAIHNLKLLLNKILKGAETNEFKLYLTGKGNFRDEVARGLPKPFNIYKGNRDSSHKPIHYHAIRGYMTAILDAEVIEGMEADDALAIAQTDDTILCSIDKDLLMVPGKHYNWRRDEKKIVSEAEGMEFFYQQILTGDMTDNIPGLYQLTGKKAMKKLKDKVSACTTKEEYEEVIYSIYPEEFHQFVDITRQLLWMRRE